MDNITHTRMFNEHRVFSVFCAFVSMFHVSNVCVCVQAVAAVCLLCPLSCRLDPKPVEMFVDWNSVGWIPGERNSARSENTKTNWEDFLSCHKALQDEVWKGLKEVEESLWKFWTLQIQHFLLLLSSKLHDASIVKSRQEVVGDSQHLHSVWLYSA